MPMPRPWFTASSSGRRIAGMLDDEPMRDLRDGERRLAGFILPPFQRPAVWTREQETAFVESIWEGLPIGSYVVNRTRGDDTCADWLLDGQQRWTTIVNYVAGQFPVFGEYFPDLPPVEKMDFRGRQFGEIETRLTDPAACERVYYRLAYGGTPHDPEEAPEAAAPRR